MISFAGFLSTLFSIALPILLQNLLQTFINILDTIMVGRLGSTEIVAVGLGNQIFFILNIILFGISSGGAIFVSQFWGKNDIKSIHKTLGITLTFSLTAALIFTTCSVLFPSKIISLYSKDVKVIQLGTEYLRYVAFSFPLLALSFTYQITLRATEHVRLPLASTSLSFVTNIICNYILIFGVSNSFFTIAPLGVKGAAIATIISRSAELLITVGVPHLKHYEICASAKQLFSFNFSFFSRFVKITTPVIINEIFWSLGITTQNAIFSHTSTKAIASLNITGTISQLTWVFFIGVGNAAGIIIGKRIGAGLEGEAKNYAKRFSWFMPLMAVFIGMFLFPLSKLLPLLFNVEPTIIEQAQKMLFILMCFYPLNAFNMFFIIGACRAGGDTIYSAINDIVWMWALGIPLAIIASFILHAEPYIMYLCLQIEQGAKLIAGIIRIKNGKWLHNVTDNI
ncbi:MAG: MATE family efflux transporter [Treponema sp.]|nr:MATE family efflux transporter [Treponema sp.]